MPRFLNGVVVYNMHPEIERVLETEKLLDKVFLDVAGRMCIVTSAREGQHRRNSWHYWGRAIDIRNRDLTEEQNQQVLTTLRSQLGPNFKILREGTHIHIAYIPGYGCE